MRTGGRWIPAFAGMTEIGTGSRWIRAVGGLMEIGTGGQWIPAFAGMTARERTAMGADTREKPRAAPERVGATRG